MHGVDSRSSTRRRRSETVSSKTKSDGFIPSILPGLEPSKRVAPILISQPKSKQTSKRKLTSKPSAKRQLTLYRVVASLIVDFFNYFLDNEFKANEREEIRVFPKFSIYFLMVLTFWSRANVALSPESLWLIHPDEVYQSIEVAHSEVYGYGFRPYEFFPPPNSNESFVSTDTNSGQQLAALGMYSMRSWLYPQVYTLLFNLKERFRWELPPFQLAKLFHAIVSAILPFIIYRFTMVLFPFNRDMAFLSAALVSFSQPLMVFGTHTIIQSFVSPFTFLALSIILQKIKNAAVLDRPPRPSQAKDANANVKQSECKECFSASDTVDKDDPVSRWKDFIKIVFASFTLGFVVYVRVDTSLTICLALMGLSAINVGNIRKCLNLLFLCFFTACLGFAIGGFIDYLTYGVPFISVQQWFMFQVRHSSKLFGSFHWYKYFTEILLAGHVVPGLTVVNLIVGVVVAVSYFSSYVWQFLSNYEKYIQCYIRLFLITVTMFTIYSCFSHKEHRFVHDAIVFYLMCSSATVFIVFKAIYGLLNEGDAGFESRKRFLKLALYGELFLYIFDGRIGYPRSSDQQSLAFWSYSGLVESGSINECLSYISYQPDVSGVFVDYSIHMTGGYALLHKNVPIIAKTHFEFREWSLESRVEVSSRFLSRNKIRINIIDKVSEFITVQNSQMVLKYLIDNDQYNYVITSGGRKLPKKGFRQVFNVSDSVRVYKRSRTRLDREALVDYSQKLGMLIKNSTILDYEGSWLLTFELYEKAVERLKLSLYLDKTKVRTFQLLSTALSRLGRKDEAINVMVECNSLHTEQICNRKTDKIVLNPEYVLGL